MVLLFEQALQKLVQTGHAPTVSKAETQDLVQTKAVAEDFVLSLLSNMGFNLLIP